MENDYQLLAEKVLLQAMMDYVRLQHPSARDRKYLSEAFMDAADMFWDPEYRIGPFEDDNGDPMDIIEFLKLAADRERVDLGELQKRLKSDTLTYWKPLEKTIMTIPEIFTIKGEPWYVDHDEQATEAAGVDFDTRRISLDKQAPKANLLFLSAVIDILMDEISLRVAGVKRKEFAIALYETLVMNDNFK